jgi:hypothetical protein
MAEFDYARSRASAERLIARFGMAGVLKRAARSGPANDPDITETDHACRLVILKSEDARAEGTLIRRADWLIYLSTAGLTIVPAETDRILANGETYSILSIRSLSPAGEVLFYEIQARR